nr:antirestriction protein ArdA [uncultured Blautia sp.]
MKNDVVFRAYLTNLGAYNEGELIGKWIDFPIQNDSLTLDESVKKILAEIGVDGKKYEEYFITDYDSEIAGLTENFGEYENLFLLQVLACKICLQYCEQYSYKNMLESMLEYGEHTGSVLELINLVCNTENFYFLPDVASDYDLGYEYAENSGMFTEVYAQMGMLRNYIDYEGYGRDLRLTEGGIHTKNGYISLTDEIITYYDSTKDISDLYE